MDLGGVLQFISEHKFWIAVAAPFVIAIVVVKLRG